MKIITFYVNHNTKQGEEEKPVLAKQVCKCTDDVLESNLNIVKKIAYNGEYTIEEVEDTNISVSPSQLDLIEAQVTYTAMMTDTLLEV